MSSARAPDFVRSDTWHRVTTLLDDIVPPSLRHALNLWDDIVEDFEPAPAERRTEGSALKPLDEPASD